MPPSLVAGASPLPSGDATVGPQPRRRPGPDAQADEDTEADPDREYEPGDRDLGGPEAGGLHRHDRRSDPRELDGRAGERRVDLDRRPRDLRPYAGLTGEVDLPMAAPTRSCSTPTRSRRSAERPGSEPDEDGRDAAGERRLVLDGRARLRPGRHVRRDQHELRGPGGDRRRAPARRQRLLDLQLEGDDDIVLYDCSKESQVWKLTTTGGFGDSASKSVKVFR